MQDIPDFEAFPEGIYIDKDALNDETTKAVNDMLAGLVNSIKEQTLLIHTIDVEYEQLDIPLFIREQASQRLGDILVDLTIVPILEKLAHLYKNEQHEL